VGGRGLPPGIVLNRTCVTCHSAQCNHLTAFKKAHSDKDGKLFFVMSPPLSLDLNNRIFQLRPAPNQEYFMSVTAPKINFGCGDLLSTQLGITPALGCAGVISKGKVRRKCLLMLTFWNIFTHAHRLSLSNCLSLRKC
jgi:hypothetical protein